MRVNWKVTAEINMDASRFSTVYVCTNTEKKARELAAKEMKKNGAFCVWITSCEKVDT